MLKYFPSISYNFGTTGGVVDLVNIFKSVNIEKDDKTELKITTIQQGERPDQLSYKLYNTFDYYWVLMLLNEIKDPLHFWNNNLNKILYLNTNKSDAIKVLVRDTPNKIINIKLSEL